MSNLLYKMLYALTSAYSRKDCENIKNDVPIKTNIGKLFSLFDWGLNLVQEQADLIKLWDNIDHAQGRVLDRYGANFGVARGSASDELYRIFIRVKMIAQLSGGDDDTVIKAAAELLGVEYSDIVLKDVWPAKKHLSVDLKLLSEERLNLLEQIAQAIKRTMAAGVGLVFNWWQKDISDVLGASHICRWDVCRWEHVELKEYGWELRIPDSGLLEPDTAFVRNFGRSLPTVHAPYWDVTRWDGLPDSLPNIGPTSEEGFFASLEWGEGERALLFPPRWDCLLWGYASTFPRAFGFCSVQDFPCVLTREEDPTPRLWPLGFARVLICASDDDRTPPRSGRGFDRELSSDLEWSGRDAPLPEWLDLKSWWDQDSWLDPIERAAVWECGPWKEEE